MSRGTAVNDPSRAHEETQKLDWGRLLSFIAVAVLAAMISSIGTLQVQSGKRVVTEIAAEPSNVRPLFSTPIYYASLTGKVDVHSLAEMAIDGYTQLRNDANLLEKIRRTEMNECIKDEEEEELCGKYMSDEWNDVLTYTDAFFKWQMEQGDNGVRAWDGMPVNMAFGIERRTDGYSYVRVRWFSRLILTV